MPELPNIESNLERLLTGGEGIQSRLRSTLLQQIQARLVAPTPTGSIGRVEAIESQIEPETVGFTSELGAFVHDQLTLGPASYTTREGTVVTVPAVTMDDAIISISMQRKVIEALPVAGQHSVFQWFANGSFAISIEHNLWAQKNFPQAKVANFKQLILAATDLPVQSRFLNALGITRMVITDPSLSQQAGTPSLLPATINGYSSAPTQVVDVP